MSAADPPVAPFVVIGGIAAFILAREDWLGTPGVLLRVLLSIFPVAIPFIVMSAAAPALHVSNAIAASMLFGLGHACGRLTGYRPGGSVTAWGSSGRCSWRWRLRWVADCTSRRSVRGRLWGLVAACLCGMPAPAADGPPLAAGDAAAEASPAWEFEASAFGYFIPGEDDYLQPGLAADRGRLHLEARYNYEDRDTASVWAGANFAGTVGEAEWELTPMLGWVFGDTRGVAPGLSAWLGWRWLEFYTEGEVVFDTGSRDDSFAYFWSELSAWPVDWLRVGLVAQRTRAYETELDVQRGVLLGVSGERWSLTGYVFNPDQDDAVVVVGAALGF